MHPTSNTELGKLEGVTWVSRGRQHWNCCAESPNTCMLYFVVWFMIYSWLIVVALDDLFIVMHKSRGLFKTYRGGRNLEGDVRGYKGSKEGAESLNWKSRFTQ